MGILLAAVPGRARRANDHHPRGALVGRIGQAMHARGLQSAPGWGGRVYCSLDQVLGSLRGKLSWIRGRGSRDAFVTIEAADAVETKATVAIGGNSFIGAG